MGGEGDADGYGYGYGHGEKWGEGYEERRERFPADYRSDFDNERVRRHSGAGHHHHGGDVGREEGSGKYEGGYRRFEGGHKGGQGWDGESGTYKSGSAVR